ncbi:unnamed protein product [Candida verbasci]|uniref:Uncharacterized protein n=1 Tax=Candida verbasci TaxID=1227364 RepID=A0A9W4X9J6_9ASCO|nr:unnamed protein product [Candida verbasci]
MLNILNDGLPEFTATYLHNGLPTWIHFFESIQDQKLVLDSLAIEGYIGETSSNCIEILSGAIDLSLLCNLQLKVKESTHSGSSHDHFDSNLYFIDLLTQKTTALQSLGVNPSYNCLLCQQESILKVLTVNLSQQLSNLSVVFESSNVKYSQQINDAICNSQHKLERLLINDKSTEVFDRALLFKCINSNQSLISLYEHGLYYEQLIIDLLFRDVWLTDFIKLDEQFIINDQMIQFIQKTNGKGLDEFLLYFLHFAFSPVVASNFKLIGKLPKLKNLNVLGLSLSINYPNGTFNKSLQELYYVANGRYISSGLTYRK